MKRFFKSFLSLNPTSITAFIILVILIVFYIGVSIFDIIELKSYDLRFLMRGTENPLPNVVLAVIDEKSVNTEGRWPWPRSKIAKMIDILSEEGAKVIGFDIGFLEPDENSSLQIIQKFDQQVSKLKIQEPELSKFIKDSKATADNDLALANSIKKSKAKIVLGHFFHMSQESLKYEIPQDVIDRQLALIGNSSYPLVRYEQREMYLDPFITAYAPEANIEIISNASKSSGYFNMFPDQDGVVRWIPLVIKCGEELYAPLSFQSVWNYLDNPQTTVKVASYGIEGIYMGETFIPTDETGQILINYLGPERTFPHYSITDILNRSLPKGTFENAIVLAGATAIGIYDMRNSPFSPVYPGLEAHATVIDNILKKNFLIKPKWAKVYDILAIIIIGIIVGIVVPRSGAIKGLLFAAIIFVVHILLCRWLFSDYDIWINMVYPLLTVVLVYTSLTTYHYVVEEKNKRFLHSTFSSYLSPELIEQMVASENMPELGGEARILTAYFTDIQSFSVFSEKLTAQQLVELLNEYLSEMTDILIREGGTLDKYEGDAIVAFLGAPLIIPDHTLRACRVAVDMQNSLIKLRSKWKEEKQVPNEPERNTKNLPAGEWAPGDKWPKVVHDMKMRIGINSGDIVVGNMGSSMRMNYTMMGDSVNLAARLEEGAKQFGIYTAVSEYTLNLEYTNENGKKGKAIDAVEARFIDNIAVVGKSEPVKIYELCAMKGELTPQESGLFDLFGRGIEKYLSMEWDAAIEYFSESLKIERIPDGKTTPSDVYIKRCRMFKENPPVSPGEKWDGVFRMTKK